MHNKICVLAGSTVEVKLESVDTTAAQVTGVWQILPQHQILAIFRFFILHFIPKHIGFFSLGGTAGKHYVIVKE